MDSLVTVILSSILIELRRILHIFVLAYLSLRLLQVLDTPLRRRVILSKDVRDVGAKVALWSKVVHLSLLLNPVIQ